MQQQFFQDLANRRPTYPNGASFEEARAGFNSAYDDAINNFIKD